MTNDVYEGFTIGVPQGWTLTRSGGGLVVSQGTSTTTEAVVVPALMTASVTPVSFYTAVTGVIEKEADSNNSSLTFTQTSSTSNGVQANVSGHVGGSDVTGKAEVVLRSYTSAHGSQLLVFSAYWAPPAQLSADQATLAGVATCYAPKAGQLLRVFRDQQFTYPMPLNWTVNEQFNILEVDDGTSASANYFFLETLTPSQGVTDAHSLLLYLLSHVGVTVTSTVATVDLPPTSGASGGVTQTEYEEFTGTLSGAAVHGLASSVAATIGGNTSGVVRLALARSDLWDQLSGVLMQITGGIQHSFVQDLGQIEQVSQEWQAFGAQVEGFDDALNGVDVVEDPATGYIYEAPYGDYIDGPAGPGYYLPGSSTPLHIITP